MVLWGRSRQSTNIRDLLGRGGLAAGGCGTLVIIIIAVVMFSSGGVSTPDSTDIDVDIDVPRPELPDAPKMPDLPDIPPVEPPSVPQPNPSPGA